MYYSWLIQSLGDGVSQALKKIWERDLNMTLDDEEWHGILKNFKINKMASMDAKILYYTLYYIFYTVFLDSFQTVQAWVKDTPYCKVEEGDLAHTL